MFHCPKCGEMVVACIPHPRWDLLDDTLSNDELNFIRGEDGEGDGAGEMGDQGPSDRDLDSVNLVPPGSVDSK